MNLISGSFHDGVMLYSHALNETLDRSGARPPGDVINKRMWNRTYHGQFCLKSPIVSHSQIFMLSDKRSAVYSEQEETILTNV